MTLKRKIFKVTLKHEIDESPDTSYLGEYSNSPSSEFSIDRAHFADCQKNNPTDGSTICANCQEVRGDQVGEDLACPDNGPYGDSYFELGGCTCSGGDMARGEYRYFNPGFNYVDKSGNPRELTPEEVRQYTRQDYDRMESLNAGHWSYIGIRATARVGISMDGGKTFKTDTLTSGGLWGIESDSDKAYIEETEQEELSQLKDTLKAYGFGRSTIAKAFKDVEKP